MPLPVYTRDMALQNKDLPMAVEKNRLGSFPSHWPHNGLLSPLNFAKAGFYYVGRKKSDDTVRCFCCFKELDGWEENDDVWQEHRNHQGNCLFANTGKPQDELLMSQMCAVLKDRSEHQVRLLEGKVSEASIVTKARGILSDI